MRRFLTLDLETIPDEGLVSAVDGVEVQIDDNAIGDPRKDFYGLRPEPNGLRKDRTGAIYKIPAKDFELKDLDGTQVRLSDFRGKESVEKSLRL